MKKSPAISIALNFAIALAVAVVPVSAKAAAPTAVAAAPVAAIATPPATIAAPAAAIAISNSAQPYASASPTASIILVDGLNVAFEAYNISGNNYFKLRDLAFALTGTAKQFDVGWNGASNAITITSGNPYTPVGGEMAVIGAQVKTAAASSAKVFLDGKETQFAAYLIDGNNYFKLRDIGAALDFGVDWDEGHNTVLIDTAKAYSAAGASGGGAPSNGAPGSGTPGSSTPGSGTPSSGAPGDAAGAAGNDAAKRQEPAGNSPWVKTTYTSDDLAMLKTRSVFFAHNSVGQNIIDSLKALETGLPVASGSQGGAKGITENTLGYNGDPAGKLNAFAASMDNGGHKAQIAMFKFCYADFQANTDVGQLFSDYVAKMDALAAKHPGVIYVHITVPLYHYNASWNNSVQHAFNEKLREKYGGLVFDLAAMEATDAAGRASFSRDGVTPALSEEWTSDGSHLNDAGGNRLASALISFLAQL
ncbi:MAG: copper amine oxidase N-terminal domain-containing protein [Oscillospiraceae bacterium]|nr:copper amine oxidase N-terminal domain-containing protein [Oscillospiraceae bacterium]